MPYNKIASERIADIKKNPQNHRHDFDGLTSCCMVNGILDTSIMEAHEGILGFNGGARCDVTKGPCACGAWH